MLGEILQCLTDPATAGDVLPVVARATMLDRIEQLSGSEGVEVGELVATRIRQLVDHGSEEVWLDLLGVTSGSPQPAAAVVERILARAFPDPVRVRITRKQER